MKDSPVFGINGFTNKFLSSEMSSKKENIFDYLNNLGLGVLELSFNDFNSLSKQDCLNFLEKKEEFKIIISIEMFNIDVKNPDKTLAKYNNFISKCISIGAKHILIPLDKVSKNTDLNVIISIVKKIRKLTPNNIQMYPEISGKSTSIGSLDDVMKICSKVKNIYPCLDLGNLHGREYGSLTSSKKIEQVFTIIEKFLGREYLENCYCKVYPVAYNKKGIVTDRKSFGEQYYGQMSLFNASLEYLPKASEYISAIIKKDIYPITISKTDHLEEIGAMQLRDIYFYKSIK